jgi:hypothetical protein
MSYIRYVVDGSNPPITASSSSASRPVSGPPDYPGNLTSPDFIDTANLKLGTNYFNDANVNFDFDPNAQALFNTSQAFNNITELFGLLCLYQRLLRQLMNLSCHRQEKQFNTDLSL